MRKLPKHIMHLQMLCKEMGGRKELADKLGLSAWAVSGWISRNTIPKTHIKKLAKLSSIFQPSDFEGEDD